MPLNIISQAMKLSKAFFLENHQTRPQKPCRNDLWVANDYAEVARGLASSFHLTSPSTSFYLISGLIAEYIRRHHYRESIMCLSQFMPRVRGPDRAAGNIPRRVFSALSGLKVGRDCNNITPMAEGHWKICRPRAKHYVARGPHDAARGQ